LRGSSRPRSDAELRVPRRALHLHALLRGRVSATMTSVVWRDPRREHLSVSAMMGLRHPSPDRQHMSLFEPIFAALENGAVRYVVVGGMATILHGYARLTADVDLIIDQHPEEARKTIRVLHALGFIPRAPVNAEDYADPEIRRGWFDDKGMRVLSLWDPQNP